MSEANGDARKDATSATRAAQAAVAASLPADDGQDFALARRGFLGSIPDADVPGAWSQRPFAFLEGERPDTINPSLWRQARLNALHGLFEVTPGVYQVRGFDISNITFIQGREGWIVIDPLTSAQPAAAALELVRRLKGDRPVTAVIYTHSHVDHYGGIMGVLSPDDIARGVPIVAPEGFLQAAVAENVLAGNVMSRRATYMYGGLLPKDPRGHVDSGLGKGTSTGKVALVAPNVSVTHTGQTLTLDGVDVVFQVTPDTEAPAEMNFHFPQFGALCMAENCTCHLHNLYTPRGAQVRDAKAWAFYIDEALEMFAGQASVMFASHHWPRFGKEDVRVDLSEVLAKAEAAKTRTGPCDEEERQVADGAALWTKAKSDISEEDYADFYRSVAGQFDKPALTLHYRAEGRHEYSVLTFIPETKPFDLFDPDRKGRIKLYVRRVFITDEAEILPRYLRFVRGLVDSADLTLNM